MSRFAVVVIVSLSVRGVPALAAETSHETQTTAPLPTTDCATAVSPLAGDVDWSLRPVQIGPTKRPGVLPALYVSLAALQVFDAYSTSEGLARGAREANPVMQAIVGNPALFWSVKAATTVAPMLLAERMWRTNRVGAIVLMAAANGVMAAVAANNARVLRPQR